MSSTPPPASVTGVESNSPPGGSGLHFPLDAHRRVGSTLRSLLGTPSVHRPPDARWGPSCALISGGVDASARATTSWAGLRGTAASGEAVGVSGAGTGPRAAGTRRRAPPGAPAARVRCTSGSGRPPGPPCSVSRSPHPRSSPPAPGPDPWPPSRHSARRLRPPSRQPVLAITAGHFDRGRAAGVAARAPGGAGRPLLRSAAAYPAHIHVPLPRMTTKEAPPALRHRLPSPPSHRPRQSPGCRDRRPVGGAQSAAASKRSAAAGQRGKIPLLPGGRQLTEREKHRPVRTPVADTRAEPIPLGASQTSPRRLLTRKAPTQRVVHPFLIQNIQPESGTAHAENGRRAAPATVSGQHGSACQVDPGTILRRVRRRQLP